MKQLRKCLSADPADERYRLAVPYISPDTKTILDVGGISYIKKNGTWKYTLGPAKQWNTTSFNDRRAGNKIRLLALNVKHDYNHERKPDMYYDGLHMEFKDSSFDLVTSIDVFEHIKQEHRISVFKEMLRVAKKRVILIFPYRSVENMEFESRLLSLMEKHSIEQKPSLLEHANYGLPAVEDFEAFLQKNGYTYKLTYGSKRDLLIHHFYYQIMVNGLISEKNNALIEKTLKLLQSIYLRISSYTSEKNSNNSYRAIIVVDKQENKAYGNI